MARHITIKRRKVSSREVEQTQIIYETFEENQRRPHSPARETHSTCQKCHKQITVVALVFKKVGEVQHFVARLPCSNPDCEDGRVQIGVKNFLKHIDSFRY